MGPNGEQIAPDDLAAPALENGEVVVHYGPTTTGSTTVAAAAERLGITPAEYRRELAALVQCGYLSRRADGSYDAEVRA